MRTPVKSAMSALALALIAGSAALRVSGDSILRPLAALRGAGQVELTAFPSLVTTWTRKFAAQTCTDNVTTGQFLQPPTQQ